MSILDQCENMFGSLRTRPDIKKRIYNYLNNPTYDNWDEISTIIIHRETFSTVWKAIIKYDPTFPRCGRSTDEDGNIVEQWERIPSPFEVMKAIQQFIN